MSKITDLNDYRIRAIDDELIGALREAAVNATTVEFALKKLRILLGEKAFAAECQRRGIDPADAECEARQAREMYFAAMKRIEGGDS